MKFLIVFALAVAAASAQYISPVATVYPGAYTTGVSHTAAYPYTAHSAIYRYRRGVVAPFAYTGYGHAAYAASPVVAHSAYPAYPYAGHSVAHLYRKRRGIVAPFAYSGYAHTAYTTPVVAHSAYPAYPYAGHSVAHLYRKRRGVVAPIAYTGYGHAAYSAYPAYPATSYGYGNFAHY